MMTVLQKMLQNIMNLSSYLSFEAFSSNTASLYDGPSIARAKHRILVVLPVPGGP